MDYRILKDYPYENAYGQYVYNSLDTLYKNVGLQTKLYDDDLNTIRKTIAIGDQLFLPGSELWCPSYPSPPQPIDEATLQNFDTDGDGADDYQCYIINGEEPIIDNCCISQTDYQSVIAIRPITDIKISNSNYYLQQYYDIGTEEYNNTTAPNLVDFSVKLGYNDNHEFEYLSDNDLMNSLLNIAVLEWGDEETTHLSDEELYEEYLKIKNTGSVTYSGINSPIRHFYQEPGLKVIRAVVEYEQTLTASTDCQSEISEFALRNNSFQDIYILMIGDNPILPWQYLCDYYYPPEKGCVGYSQYLGNDITNDIANWYHDAGDGLGERPGWNGVAFLSETRTINGQEVEVDLMQEWESWGIFGENHITGGETSECSADTLEYQEASGNTCLGYTFWNWGFLDGFNGIDCSAGCYQLYYNGPFPTEGFETEIIAYGASSINFLLSTIPLVRNHYCNTFSPPSNSITISKTDIITAKFYLNVDEVYKDEFSEIGGTGFDYLPWPETSPVIGGISDESKYINDVINIVNQNQFKETEILDKQKAEEALQNDELGNHLGKVDLAQTRFFSGAYDMDYLLMIQDIPDAYEAYYDIYDEETNPDGYWDGETEETTFSDESCVGLIFINDSTNSILRDNCILEFNFGDSQDDIVIDTSGQNNKGIIIGDYSLQKTSKDIPLIKDDVMITPTTESTDGAF
tara:strand:- start:258 stop:2324 length:2067 start_codon:yes stop_codon:yes gene_type:complete